MGEQEKVVLDAAQLLEQLQKEGRSLTKAEREKMRGPQDAIYVRERVRFHGRQLNFARLGLLLVYLTMLLGVFTVFYYPRLAESSQLWMKGLLVLLAVLSLVLLSALLVNHGRNAALLRLSDFVHEQMRAADAAENEATAVPTKQAGSATLPDEQSPSVLAGKN